MILDVIQKFRSIISFRAHDTSSVDGQSNERYRRIFLTGGSTAIVKLFTGIIGIITVPLTVNYLGAERYGLWMAISSIMVLMSFADLGLGNGLLNAISKANGKNSVNNAQIAVASTFYMLLGISAFLFFIFLLIYPFVAWHKLFNVQSELAIDESAPAMLVFVVTFLINMPLGIVRRIQDGYQEGYKFQLWLIGGSFFSLVGILLCIYFETGLPWLVLAFSSGQVIATLLNGIILFTKKRKYLIPKIKYFRASVGKKLIKAGVIFFFLSLFTLLSTASDNIIIAQILGAASVSGYEIVKKLFLFSMFTQFLIQPLWPAFGEALERGDIAWAERTLKKGIMYSVLICAITSLPLLVFGRSIVNIWLGVEYIPSWSLLFGFYCFVLIANYGGVMSTFLNSGPLLKKQLKILGFTSIASVIFKIYFTYAFNVSGVIWATVISHLMFYIIPSYKLAFGHFRELAEVRKLSI